MDSLTNNATLSTALQSLSSSSAEKEVKKLSAGSVNASKTGELKQVAEQFEALFVEKMMEAARKSELAEGLLNNKGSETFYSLLDQEYAGLTSQTSSLGIADALVAQFRPNEQNKEQN